MAPRRNNYSRTSRVTPFSGVGNRLVSRRPGPISRIAGLARAAYPYARHVFPYALRAATTVARSSSSFSSAPSRQAMTTQRAEYDGSGGMVSKFSYGTYKLRIPRSIVKTLMPQYKQTNSSSRWTGTVGVQTASIALSCFDGTDLVGLYGSGFIGKHLIIDVRAKVLLTNVSNATACVTIYDIVAKKNINSSTMLTPLGAWQQGIDDQETGGSSTAYKTLGVTPYASDAFRQNYQILKKTEAILGQGVMQQHDIYFAPNRQINQSEFQYNQALKDLTIFTMVVYHGAPANDSVTKTQVSTGHVDIDMVAHKEYCWKNLSQSATSYDTDSNIVTAFTTGQNVLNIGSGAVATETEA